MLPGPVLSGARSSPQLVDDMDGRRRRRGDAQLADDVLIAPEPIVGMLQVDAERVLSELLGSGAAPGSYGTICVNPRAKATGISSSPARG